jgi:hypothetical protein
MATIQAVIVDPDGTVRHTDIEDTLESFQVIVGGYIQPVFGDVATMYVDEDGLSRRLPHNPLATLFAQRVLGAGVVLCGTALILGPTAGGRDTPVRPTVVEYFTKEN